MDLCGNRLLQNHFENTLCGIKWWLVSGLRSSSNNINFFLPFVGTFQAEISRPPWYTPGCAKTR